MARGLNGISFNLGSSSVSMILHDARGMKNLTGVMPICIDITMPQYGAMPIRIKQSIITGHMDSHRQRFITIYALNFPHRVVWLDCFVIVLFRELPVFNRRVKNNLMEIQSAHSKFYSIGKGPFHYLLTCSAEIRAHSLAPSKQRRRTQVQRGKEQALRTSFLAESDGRIRNVAPIYGAQVHGFCFISIVVSHIRTSYLIIEANSWSKKSVVQRATSRCY